MYCPYGLVYCQSLVRFIVSLCRPNVSQYRSTHVCIYRLTVRLYIPSVNLLKHIISLRIPIVSLCIPAVSMFVTIVLLFTNAQSRPLNFKRRHLVIVCLLYHSPMHILPELIIQCLTVSSKYTCSILTIPPISLEKYTSSIWQIPSIVSDKYNSCILQIFSSLWRNILTVYSTGRSWRRNPVTFGGLTLWWCGRMKVCMFVHLPL